MPNGVHIYILTLYFDIFSNSLYKYPYKYFIFLLVIFFLIKMPYNLNNHLPFLSVHKYNYLN